MLRSCFLLALAGLFGFAATAQIPAGPAAEAVALVGTYRLTYQPDSLNAAGRRAENMLLFVGERQSQFRSEAALRADSLVAASEALPWNQATAQAFVNVLTKLPLAKFDYSVYKTLAAKQVLFYDKIGSTTYFYAEPADLLSWQISPATATIAGYACQRATTTLGGRAWEAWFAREVPVADGPYKFYGLPGLIVQVSDTRQHYRFELLKLVRPATPRLIAPPTKKAVRASKAELRQAQASYAAGLLDRVAAMGNTLTEADRLAAHDRAKKRNNPLELK